MRKRYLNKITFNSDGPRDFGVNKFSTKLSHDSILDAKLAEELVKSWYKKGENYNYLSEPLNNDAGKLMAEHRMFIIMFLELLINYYNNYRNKFTQYQI